MLKKIIVCFAVITVFLTAESSPEDGLNDMSPYLFKVYSKPDYNISTVIDTLKVRYSGDIFIKEIEQYSSLSGGSMPAGDRFFMLYKEEKYREITHLEPKNIFQHYIKTIAFYRLSMIDSAIVSAEDMYRRDEGMNDDEIKNMIAAFLMKKGLEDSAYSIIRNSSTDHAKLLKGIYFYNKSLLDSSLNYLINARGKEIEPVSFQMLADIFTKQNDYEQALYFIRAFEKDYYDFDSDFYMTYLKAEIHYRKGYFKRSIIYFQDAAYNTSNPQIKGNAYYWIGKSYFMLGDYENMEKYLSLLVRGGMESDYKKNAFFLDGKGFYLKGDYSKAVKKLVSFIEEYPHDNLTPYALEMITEGYFRMGRYSKSAEYISMIKKPDFILEKTKRIKYFLDYKNGVYTDSISAYSEFLNREPSNPFRREVFQFIIENTESDSVRSDALNRFAMEFPESEKYREYIEKYREIILKWDAEELAGFMLNMTRSSSKNSYVAAVELFGYLFERKMYSKIVYLYSNIEGKDLAENPKIIYCAAVSLARMKNTDGAIILLKGLADTEGTYSDSALYELIDIGFAGDDVEMLDELSSESKIVQNNYMNAFLMQKKGMLLRNLGKNELSVNVLIKSAELFEDDRNSSAVSLLEASVSAYENDDHELSSMLLEKALLMATDIEIINRIRMENERRKKN